MTEVNRAFYCLGCGAWTLVYDGHGCFHCENCTRKLVVQASEAKCHNCLKPYLYYTGFDPIACPHCKRDFYEPVKT